MIIDFYINSNNYNENVLESYIFNSYVCPKCGSKHSWIRHATYERNVVIIKNGEFVDSRIKILRLKCNSCNSTHALLPGDIIPYFVYSTSCIIKLISEHYTQGYSVLYIAKKYNVPYQLIYWFLNIFVSFVNECNITLRILKIIKGISNLAAKEIIEIITNRFKDNSFTKEYAMINDWPFLMKKFRNNRFIPIYIGFENL